MIKETWQIEAIEDYKKNKSKYTHKKTIAISCELFYQYIIYKIAIDKWNNRKRTLTK